ncbi:MAG: single-stranded DNA-binding protein [Crocinitomicaceae bacterium]|nr:single-stranded DNA-binding protein [Crocinitomicaceae bacterium]
MSNIRNRVSLIGRTGKETEVLDLKNDKKLAKVTLATNDYYYNAEGEKVEDTQWHNLVMFGKTAEVAEKFVKKGQKIAIDGKIVNRSFETKEGEKKYITEVHVNELELLDKAN